MGNRTPSLSLSHTLSSLSLTRLLSPSSHENKGGYQTTTALSSSPSDTTVASGVLCLLHMLVLHELDRLVAWTGDQHTSLSPSHDPGPIGEVPSSIPSPSTAPVPSPVSCALPADAVTAIHEAYHGVSKDVKSYKLAILAAWAMSPALALALRDRCETDTQ